jgi:hypothetical protein
MQGDYQRNGSTARNNLNLSKYALNKATAETSNTQRCASNTRLNYQVHCCSQHQPVFR